jgi:hypothetical protein
MNLEGRACVVPFPFSFTTAAVRAPVQDMSRWLALLFLCANVAVPRSSAAPNEPFSIRGYYVTFMRMPTFGLPEWKQMIDCMKEDRANTLILWTAGGFRSKQFPITWKYNVEHKNVERDYVRDLIDYAHTKQIRVLLGFTPFAYDGVNQFPLESPELKAKQKNGQPANLWGMHSWGYNLCPSKETAQKLMLGYVREMFFDFYPNADGLMIESSDYAICYCRDCREKFFDLEFQFVRQISDDVWRAKTNATIMVYPSYFNGRKVPGFDVSGAKQQFDPRWTLFFTPHSAHIDDELLKQASGSVYSDSGLTLGTPNRIRDGARVAQKHGLSGYVPSCEPFSCIDGPPGSNKARLKPFHFQWLRDGEMPLNELAARVNRIAYREYTREPSLSDERFRAALGHELFDRSAAAENLADLLFLQECLFTGADWFSPPPIWQPAELKRRGDKDTATATKLRQNEARVARLRTVAARYRESTVAAEREMAKIADEIVRCWDESR